MLCVFECDDRQGGADQFANGVLNGSEAGSLVRKVPFDSSMVSVVPQLNNNHVQVWGNYAIVSNEERKRMACAPRDMLIEQVQSVSKSVTSESGGNASVSANLRFSHSVKALMFAAQRSDCVSLYANSGVDTATPGFHADGTSPILRAELVYENTRRLGLMISDYYAKLQPYYHAPRVPCASASGEQPVFNSAGMHMYSYSLDLASLDPMGSTNYGKLTNVELNCEMTDVAAGGSDDGVHNYKLVVNAINNNIVRISGGALGFPVL